MPKSPDYPPEGVSGAAEEMEAKRRILGVIKDYVPRRGQELEKGSPAYYATQITVILNKLLPSKQLDVWPREGEDSSEKIWPEGETVRLAYFDNDGKPHLSEDTLTIPSRPRSFIEALEAFRAGRPWEEVVTLNEFDPEPQQKELAKSIERIAAGIRSLNDAAAAVGYLRGARITSPKVLTPLLVLIDQRVELVMSAAAASCTTLADVTKEIVDAKEFFRKSGEGLSPSSAYTYLDARAAEIAIGMLDQAKSKAAVEAAEREISQFSFAVQGYYQQKVNARIEDVRARLKLMLDVRNAASLEELMAVEERSTTQQYSRDEVTEAYRGDLQERIERKRKALKARKEA